MSNPWDDFKPQANNSDGPWNDFKAFDQSASATQEQPSNAGLQGVADTIQGGLDTVMQPLGQASDAVARGASNLMFGSDKPAQYAEQGLGLVGQGIQKIGEGVAGGTGYVAQKLAPAGANMVPSDYAAATAGMAASAIPQLLISKYLAGKPTVNADEGLPLKVAQAREARTGVPARDFQRLAKDPGAIFAGGNVQQAGADIGAAKAAAGINPGVTNDLSSLTPENIDRINPTKAIKIEDINTVLGKITGGQTPSPQEAQNALDSVNSILSTPSVQNNRDVFRQWSAIKTHLNDALGQVAPDVREANQVYAREKLGQAFSSMNAVNKSGTPSKLAMLAGKIPAALGGAVGGAIAGPTGAVAGYEGGKIISGLYHSPFVAGLQTAAGGALNNTINPLLSGVERNASGPLLQAYLAKYHRR
jgi:hypothetical protein